MLLSCNQQIKFDRTKWKTKDDMEYPYRNDMLKDLTTNYKLVGLKYAELLELLGQPNFKDSSSLTYKIIEDYKQDIDPVYTKNLNFTFSSDSVITLFKIDEWKKGQ